MTPLCGEVDRNVDYAFSEGAFWEPKGGGAERAGQNESWANVAMGGWRECLWRLDSASWQPGLDK